MASSALDPKRIDAAADELAAAQREHRLIPRSVTSGTATLDDGYAVQRALIARLGGEGAYGWKIGTTSKAAMSRLGIDEPLYGILNADGVVASGGIIDMHGLTAPRIEMELAVITSAELAQTDCTIDDVLEASAYAVPAFEIIDTRYQPGTFDVVAAVADNMSTARHVLGTEFLDPRAIDLAAVTATLRKNGEVIASGSGAEVYEHPAASLAWLVRTLARDGRSIPAGSVILTGGFADALPAADGDVFTATYSHGGTISCTFRSDSSERSS